MNTGGGRAWRFLKRNPRYIEARGMTAPAPREPAPFPLRAQTEADLDAAAWGLLAWEDPADDGLGSPFWAEAPTLEAIASPSASPAVAEIANESGWGLSGLPGMGGAKGGGGSARIGRPRRMLVSDACRWRTGRRPRCPSTARRCLSGSRRCRR